MIPQGIFLAEGTPEQLAATHISWGADVTAFGPWRSCGSACDFGREWLRASQDCGSTIVVIQECATTMDVAREMAGNDLLSDWGAVISVVQKGGRGQLRRPWVSLPGNLHASIVLPKPPTAGLWAESLSNLLPLVAGSLFADALESLGASVQLKWPNDILQDGRKIGGMLIEERNDLIILGLGLNLAGCPEDALMRDDCSASADIATIPLLTGGPLTLLETLVNRGENVYAVMLDEIPPTQFIRSIENRLAWMGQTIQVHEGNLNSYEAVIVGLSPQGGLVVLRGGEETVLFSGSIFPL